MSKQEYLQIPAFPPPPPSLGFILEIETMKNALAIVNSSTSRLASVLFSPLMGMSPTSENLHLKIGEVKELSDGIFLKRKDKKVLELYISED